MLRRAWRLLWARLTPLVFPPGLSRDTLRWYQTLLSPRAMTTPYLTQEPDLENVCTRPPINNPDACDDGSSFNISRRSSIEQLYDPFLPHNLTFERTNGSPNR